ncbi:TlpA family protein disulfide reductase [Sphingobacterium humi]|uniref:Redoxin domain-containing protein n=1 Tax=Sphingobacterium humi TaxID=1796905 RepID=A0A6N8KVE0_9SPHI|nr:TlpA disulfide reductase family protein [Sphingobacterium humi]MVZ60774.1 redoxin domain-containing protein [Sphingobacterium humi]
MREQQPTTNKGLAFIKKNGFTIVMVAFFALMIFSPDSKAWVLRQLMATGLFNAKIEEKATTEAKTYDFTYANEQGERLSTASLRGKVVFINFWASWCPPCRAEFPSIEKLYQQYKNNPDVVFIMINQDDEAAAGKQYLDKEHFTFPMHRIDGPIANELYTGTLPTTIVLDKQGKIRLKHEGFADYSASKFMKQLDGLVQE